jgi:hypothetical protein
MSGTRRPDAEKLDRSIRSGRTRSGLLQDLDPPNALWLILLVATHLAIGTVVYRYHTITYLHSGLVICAGLYWAVKRRSDLVAVAGAYLAGAELVWRIAGGTFVWEFSKYGIVLIFIVSLLFQRRSRVHSLSLMYFVLLLPSVFWVLFSSDSPRIQQTMSFNMSGPFCLFISVWFFSNLALSGKQFLVVLGGLLGPTVGTATLTLLGMANAKVLQFTNESNSAMSAGFGPNQVSAILGLGVLSAFYMLLCCWRNPVSRYFLVMVILFLAAQSALTFSRGGLYNAGGAIVAGSAFLLRSPMRNRLLGLSSILAILIVFLVLPRLDRLTGGALTTRFHDTGLTKRDSIIRADFEAWKQNPILGAGPGMGSRYRVAFSGYSASHTEFSRMVSEHGLFGLLSMLLLLGMPVQRLLSLKDHFKRAIFASLVVWSFLFMTNAGMRLAAPSFMFGLAFASLGETRAKNLLRTVIVRRPPLVLHDDNLPRPVAPLHA